MTWFREKEPVQTSDTVTSGREGPGKFHLELQAVQIHDQVRFETQEWEVTTGQ